MQRLILYLVFILTGLSVSAQDSVWLARTTGKFPFMEYGIGDDRLGGAKMGFLDSNVLVKIVDSFATDYKIQLSTAHSAYIAKTSVIPFLRKQTTRHITHNLHL